MTPQGIIVHHSLTKDGKVVDYDAIKRYHMREKGWSDIGYHFIIEQVGDEVVTIDGRPLHISGAHCIGKNNYAGICVVGNYDIGKEILSDEKMEALVALTANLMIMFDISIEKIKRHHDYHPKSCPGTGFPWEEYLDLVRETCG
jgi:N-acetylmuramoyl-L-alanine amidase